MTGPLITLTTDFGWGSSYVAQLKGVLFAALPDARIVDVTHDLPAHSIRHAEISLRGTAFVFPLATTHLVVIDPGVGTARRPIACEARGNRFVGPDNGVLGRIVAQPDARAVVLDKPALFRHPITPTFHGRDVFAPVAAELAGGLALTDVGTPVDDPLPSTMPDPTVEPSRVCGETLTADRFGNLLSNVAAHDLRARGWREGVWVRVGGQPVPSFATYGEAPSGELFVLQGSDGYLEVAMREDSAADRIGQAAGVEVEYVEERR